VQGIGVAGPVAKGVRAHSVWPECAIDRRALADLRWLLTATIQAFLADNFQKRLPLDPAPLEFYAPNFARIATEAFAILVNDQLSIVRPYLIQSLRHDLASGSKCVITQITPCFA
jgi:hypothetical protein